MHLRGSDVEAGDGGKGVVQPHPHHLRAPDLLRVGDLVADGGVGHALEQREAAAWKGSA